MLLVASAAAGTLVYAGMQGARPPSEVVEPGEALLVFAEFGANADEIFVAPASDAEARTLIETVEHAPGWGLNPAPQVAGGRTAYTVLPRDVVPSRESPAELWLLDVDARDATRLARDADLLAAPVLSEDGGMLAYRRTDDRGLQEIVRVDLETRARRVMHTDSMALGVFPVGFDAAGSVLFARLSPSGTDLMRAVDGGTAELVLHASDEIARDWRVAPGGRVVAFLAPEVSAERVVHRARLASLDGSTVGEPPAVAGEQYAPAWRSDGVLAIGASLAPLVLGAAEAVALPTAASGFDVPLGWSVDGGYLAVRHFDGVDSQAPGHATLVIIGGGRRSTVEATRELIFLGWARA